MHLTEGKGIIRHNEEYWGAIDINILFSQKKFLKGKIKFCNVGAHANADAEISKWLFFCDINTLTCSLG